MVYRARMNGKGYRIDGYSAEAWGSSLRFFVIPRIGPVGDGGDVAIDLGVGVVVQDAGRVLLIKREDFEVWALPAGGVESGETLAQTAIREVREETGLVVELT